MLNKTIINRIKNEMKMKNSIYPILIILLLCFQDQCLGQEVNNIVIGTKFKMESKILNEERSYIVGLPASYNESTNTYPVLVLLDGESNFPVVSGMINKMNQSQIPEMIIVAVVNTDRTRDFTPTNSIIFLDGSEKPQYQITSGGSAAFLDFLEEELLVEIEKKYKTNSYRTLVGHSYAGLLTGSSYLSNNSSFDSYIAIDPSFWWDDQIILKDIDNANIESLKRKKLYISSAYKYETWKKFGLTRKSQDLFFAKLQNENILSPNLKIEYFEEENHWTMPILSFYYGLKFIYQDFYIDDIKSMSVDDIISYYKSRFGGKFLPPESTINKLAYSYLKKDKDKSLDLFLLNSLNYPKSYNAFDSLAEAYKTFGNKKEALSNYRISLKLNPENINAKKSIKELGEDK
jgi:predicted alpha/beta superfamily hydrolase